MVAAGGVEVQAAAMERDSEEVVEVAGKEGPWEAVGVVVSMAVAECSLLAE